MSEDREQGMPLSDEQMPFKRQKREKPGLPKSDLVADARATMPNMPDPGTIRKKVQEQRKEVPEEEQKDAEGLVHESIEKMMKMETPNYPEPDLPELEEEPSPAFKTTRTGGVEFGAPAIKKSPMVMMLRQKFGVEEIPTIDRDIGGFKWTFRKVTFRDKLFAKMAALQEYEGGQMDAFDLAKVCSCIVALNQMPLWKAMGIKSRPGEHIHEPLFPPPSLHQRAAGELYDEIKGLDGDLSEKLVEAYKYEYKHSDVSSYLDFIKDNRFRFVCPKENCDYEVIDIQMQNPKTDELLPYYCKFHGCPLEREGEASSYPLM